MFQGNLAHDAVTHDQHSFSLVWIFQTSANNTVMKFKTHIFLKINY